VPAKQLAKAVSLRCWRSCERHLVINDWTPAFHGVVRDPLCTALNGIDCQLIEHPENPGSYPSRRL